MRLPDALVAVGGSVTVRYDPKSIALQKTEPCHDLERLSLRRYLARVRAHTHLRSHIMSCPPVQEFQKTVMGSRLGASNLHKVLHTHRRHARGRSHTCNCNLARAYERAIVLILNV